MKCLRCQHDGSIHDPLDGNCQDRFKLAPYRGRTGKLKTGIKNCNCPGLYVMKVRYLQDETILDIVTR